MNRWLAQFVLWRTLLPGLFALLFAPSLWALDTVILDDGVDQWMSTSTTQELLRDPDDTLRIDDILQGNQPFIPAWQDVVNLGNTTDSVWLHVPLRNDSRERTDSHWILELAYARLARVDIFLVQNGAIAQQARIGYAQPISSRAIKHHFFAQPLMLQPGQQYDLYLNVMRKGGGIQIPLRLYRPDRFSEHMATSNHIYGLYFGIMFAMLVYNSFLLVSVGHRAYFYYILHIAGTFCTFQVLYGYAFLHWWPETPVINEYGIQITTLLTGMAGLLFVRHYIDLRRYQAWMNQAINVMLVIGTLLVAARLLGSHHLIPQTGSYIGVSAILMLTIATLCWRQGSRAAGYFLLAWTMFLAGASLHLLTMAGVLPTNNVTTFAVIMGSAFEVLLLSLGLADRINHERRARYLALQEKHDAIMGLKAAEERLIERAMHSATTGLPNRAYLRSTLETLFQNNDAPKALLLLSLDNFHEFNKTLGHHNGDKILRLVANHIEQTVKQQDHVIPIEADWRRTHHTACIEGVTFALLLKHTDTEAIDAFGRSLLQSLEQPFEFQNLTLDISASIGIALCPEHGNTTEELLRNAHIALEMAYQNGDNIAFYAREIDPYNARRLSLLAELREAIAKDQLQLYLQPQIDLHTQQIVGAEVLIRWQHPEHGFIPPAEFIPLAERTGVIHPLTLWVCRKSFEISKQLKQAGHDLMLSINISARNLQTAGFAEQITRFAKDTGVRLDHITMELTETAVMIDQDDALRVMSELASVGIHLSIDDFGTGYSSLSYLKKLPVDEIKIDRSFIKDMLTNSDDHVIVHTTLSMGHNLGLKVVAEGIEDAPTLDRLRTMGCDAAQGYHIAKPMPAGEFVNWLEGKGKEVDVSVHLSGRI